MRDAFEILEDAIPDCGYWRWWAANLPNSFQVEFGGVQLFQPPPKGSCTPSTIYALRFLQPRRIEFLDFAADVEKDWFSLLQADKLKPPGLWDQFFLGEATRGEQLRRQAVHTHLHFEAPHSGGGIFLAFRAGKSFGLFVAAESVQLVSPTGEIPLSLVARLYGEWWDYWRNYWKLKDTPEEMPRDDMCEICIPAGD
ncbi:MAG TPA: hypothetical protein VF773_00990 [Verrucomicrobiae bacterium]